MSLRMRDALAPRADGLRHEPTPKRIRARLGDRIVVDSTRAVLVWEPSRLVPSFAVPREHVPSRARARGRVGDVVQRARADAGRRARGARPRRSRSPSTRPRARPSACARTATGSRARPSGRPIPISTGSCVLDSAAFDAWYEEEQPRSSATRATRSTGSSPAELAPGADRARRRPAGRERAPDAALRRHASCPCATTFRATTSASRCAPAAPAPAARTRARRPTGRPRSPATSSTTSRGATTSPLREAAPVAGLICFFDERVDVTVDGEPQERPVTPWSDG